MPPKVYVYTYTVYIQQCRQTCIDYMSPKVYVYVYMVYIQMQECRQTTNINNYQNTNRVLIIYMYKYEFRHRISLLPIIYDRLFASSTHKHM